jgi:hypothetical protein
MAPANIVFLSVSGVEKNAVVAHRCRRPLIHNSYHIFIAFLFESSIKSGSAPLLILL